uniref:Uncharacterized protein n=1 Tax=Rhizophagus irregularis (strain DAOM 181602 / DAOM 197198 / MUCL 43194) TaxID=747089 RepID=U9SQR6_RHIID
MPLEDSVETETNTSSSQSSIKLSVCRTGEVQVLPKDTKVSYDYIVAQDFIQEVSSELIDEDDVQVIDGNQELTTDMTIEVELAHLFLEHLSGITLETLRKRTQRAIKIYKLFEKIGVDRIKNIKSYSADSISKFTKPQIQIILNYFGGSCYADTEIKNPNSYSECKDIEKVRPKVPLEKSQGSVPKKLPDVKISTLPTSQTLKTNQTNALEVQEKYLDSVEVNIGSIS